MRCDFHQTDLALDGPAIRRKHCNHLSAALAAVERMLALRETHKGREGRSYTSGPFRTGSQGDYPDRTDLRGDSSGATACQLGPVGHSGVVGHLWAAELQAGLPHLRTAAGFNRIPRNRPYRRVVGSPRGVGSQRQQMEVSPRGSEHDIARRFVVKGFAAGARRLPPHHPRPLARRRLDGMRLRPPARQHELPYPPQHRRWPARRHGGALQGPAARRARRR